MVPEICYAASIANDSPKDAKSADDSESQFSEVSEEGENASLMNAY